MTGVRLVRAELRKLTTTRILWGFVGALVVISGLNALAIVMGTDMDGSKAFIATAEDQQSLLAFGVNALLGTGLFGAMAVAREYGHQTVVPTFLATPRRHVAMAGQLAAVLVAGMLLALLGQVMVLATGAISLQFTDYDLLLSAATITRLLATAMLAGGVGAVLGAGIGAIVRNAGGAVASSVGVLFILPQIVPQLVPEAADWMPAQLLTGLAGVAAGPSLLAAVAALLAWAATTAGIGVGLVQRRDVA